MSAPVSTNAFPLYERFCGFQSAFQPYMRANNEIFHNNEIYQPQLLTAPGDGNLFSCADTLKTFTELKSMPVQAHPGIAIQEPIPMRVLPSAYFQPFAAPQMLPSYEYAGHNSTTQTANVSDMFRQPVRHYSAARRQYPLPEKSDSIVQTQTPPPDNEEDEEDTLYVNAKQFARIMQRREARVKLEREGRISRTRKKYLHESRHRHAMSRARGEGGKFGRRREEIVIPQTWPDFPFDQLSNLSVQQTQLESSPPPAFIEEEEEPAVTEEAVIAEPVINEPAVSEPITAVSEPVGDTPRRLRTRRPRAAKKC